MSMPTRSARILVVEDEPIIGAALEESLTEQGYLVPQILDSVDQVLPAIRDHKPDLILMDVKLNSFNDGIDAANRLRLMSAVPILFLTAYTDDRTRARAAAIPGTGFLGKPLDESKLVAEIRRLLPPSKLAL